MVFNCLSRKIAGLPLTLLELNVMVHVLCALVVYICWWKKPHDVGWPILLSETLLDEDSWALVYTMDKYGPMLRCSREMPAQIEVEIATDTQTSYPSDKSEEQPLMMAETPKNNLGYTLDLTGNSTADKLDHQICASAARKMRQLVEKSSKLVSCDSGDHPLFTPRIKMLHNESVFQVDNGSPLLLFLLCMAYGGLHVTAWNSHFPTSIERTLWRISCLVVGTPGLGVLAFEMAGILWHDKDHKELMKSYLNVALAVIICLFTPSVCGGLIYGMVVISRRPSTALRGFLLFLLILGLLLSLVAILVLEGFALFYLSFLICNSTVKTGIFALATPLALICCSARAYIVIESFISVRSLPVGAYSTFSWENFWPHL